MKYLLLSILSVLSVKTVQAYNALGVDVSQMVSVGSWSCIHNAGYDFAIPRGYCSYGAMDGNARTNVANAHAGGMYLQIHLHYRDALC